MEKITVLLSIIANAILFFFLHFRQHKDGVPVAYEGKKATKPSSKPNWRAMKTQLSHCVPTSKNIIRYSQKRVSRYGANYTTFAAFMCLNYILPYFMWSDGEAYHYNTLTATRLLGTTMCILLLLKNYWPTRALKYFPTYWHTTVMYVLPFSATLSFLIMGGTTKWLINISLTIIMLSAVVDGLSFIILGVLGAVLGITFYYLLFYVLGNVTPSSLDLVTRHNLSYTCIFSTLIGFLFFRRRVKVVDKRMDTLELFGRVIGAEVRNILAMSKAYASNIQFSSNQLHIEKMLPPEDHQELYLVKVNKQVYLSLQETIDSLMRNSERGIQTLHRILATLRKDVNTDDFTMLSMQKCITDALALYGLTKHQEGNLFINLDEDFQFYGSTYYIQHILFNLLDNAYKHSKKNCTLEIWLSNNRLYVKDDGSGIAKEALPYIFDPFFTTDKEAMGIGLSFCRLVMEAFKGTIICKSKQGEESFTEFILTFPADVNITNK